MNMKKSILFILIILIAYVSSCQKDKTIIPKDPVLFDSSGTQTLKAIIKNSTSLSLLYTALDYTGLIDTINTGIAYTVFAPDDIAFGFMGINSADQIRRLNKDTLSHLLRYHILKNVLVYQKDIPQKPGNAFQNVDSSFLYVSRPYQISGLGLGDFTSVNGVLVKQTDIKAINGVIHILHNVLKYPYYSNLSYLQSDTSFSILLALLHQFNLDKQLASTGPQTVFAVRNNFFRLKGINENNVAQYDSIRYRSLLVSPYILNSTRFFTTDIFDFAATPGGQSEFILYNPEKTFQITIADFNSSQNLSDALAVDVLGYDAATNLNYNVKDSQILGGGLYSGISNIGDPNHITTNGVIQIVNRLLVFPPYALNVH